MSKPTYLDPSRVTCARACCAPRARTRDGYGAKLPTMWMLLLDGKRWHRVYTMQWSNMGTPYVLVRGEPHLLGTIRPDTLPRGGQHLYCQACGAR